MYIGWHGNYVLTDQYVGGFQVVYNSRLEKYQLNVKNDISLVFSDDVQKFYHNLFGQQFKRGNK